MFSEPIKNTILGKKKKKRMMEEKDPQEPAPFATMHKLATMLEMK